MRCKVCDKPLSNSESVQRDRRTGEYFDTCSTCLGVTFKSLDGFNLVAPENYALDNTEE